MTEKINGLTLEEMRAIAIAASHENRPPWDVVEEGPSISVVSTNVLGLHREEFAEVSDIETATCFATFDPPTVLALLDALEDAEKGREYWQGQAKERLRYMGEAEQAKDAFAEQHTELLAAEQEREQLQTALDKANEWVPPVGARIAYDEMEAENERLKAEVERLEIEKCRINAAVIGCPGCMRELCDVLDPEWPTLKTRAETAEARTRELGDRLKDAKALLKEDMQEAKGMEQENIALRGCIKTVTKLATTPLPCPSGDLAMNRLERITEFLATRNEASDEE